VSRKSDMTPTFWKGGADGDTRGMSKPRTNGLVSIGKSIENYEPDSDWIVDGERKKGGRNENF